MAKSLLLTFAATAAVFCCICCRTASGFAVGPIRAVSAARPTRTSSSPSAPPRYAYAGRRGRSSLFAEVSSSTAAGSSDSATDTESGATDAESGATGDESGVTDAETEAGGVSSSLDDGVDKEKASLMRLILATSIDEKETAEMAEKVNSIVDSLTKRRQGFQEDEVDGEWVLCFTRNSKGSPSLQKALPGDRGFQNFDVGAKKFFNIVKLWGGKVQVLADVAYTITPEEPNKLQSTIVGAGVKLGPLRLPLPLTGRVGYLEFVYQDSDIRITRGNRGGLFLHMRPGSSFAIDPTGA